MQFLKAFALLLLLGCFSPNLYASHAVGIDLSYVCLGGNQYQFNVSFYRDCDGIAAPTSLTIDISSASCGISTSQTLSLISNQEVSQICGSMLNNTTCNGGNLPGIQEYNYSGTFTFPLACNDWVVGYSMCCRNSAITNLQNPGSQDIYAEANIDNTGGNCNSSPTFSNLPVPYICDGQPFSYNHGAVDPDGNTLVYTLVSTQNGPGSNTTYVGGFTPNNPLAVTGPFLFDINTGQMSFTPNGIQQAVITVLIDEYDAGGNWVGSTMRDLQVVVLSCSNNAPTPSGIDGVPNVYDYTVCAGSSFCFDINSNDPNAGDNVAMTWNNGIPAASFTTSGSPFETGTFCWTPTLNDIGTHYFTVTVEDDACPIPGINTLIYEIIVTPSPDPPVDAGLDQTVCFGDTVNLNAIAGPGAVYTWTPSPPLSCTNCANPSLTAMNNAIYTVSALYPSGCSQIDNVSVTITPDPTVSIFPQSFSICSGSSATLTATTDPLNTVLWSPGGQVTTTIIETPATTTVYTCTVTSPTGCTSEASVTVTVSPPPPAEVCNNIYVTTTGAGSGLTPADPTDLLSAILMSQCNNSTIKMAIGTYTIDNAIVDILGYTTLEGGYDPGNNWTKTSLPGATTIYRSNLNPEGGPSQPRLVAIYMNNSSYFRFQDLTIEVADATVGTQEGTSTYALHFRSCSNYDVVRCRLIAGNASNGVVGITGGNGGNGGNGLDGSTGGCNGGIFPSNDSGGTGGNGGAAGLGGTGGAGVAGTAGEIGGFGGGGGSDNGTTTATTTVDQNQGVWNGKRGQATSCGVGGIGGSRSGDGNCGNNAGKGFDGVSCGAAGTNGTNGIVAPPSYLVGFFIPGTGTSGTGGTGGGGGSGGGGGGGDDEFLDVGGDGGKGGGGGGGGGESGSGGFGGGSSYPVFIWGNGTNGNFTDVDLIEGNFGAGGPGGIGGAGGIGGNGHQTQTCGCGDGNDGGLGGNGSNGGSGGNGGDGVNGISTSAYIDGLLPTFTNNSVALALVIGENTLTDFNLPAQPEIFVENISCTNTDLDYSSAASGNWDLDAVATNQTPTGALVTTQYSTIGRKDIDYGVETYTGFSNITLDGVADPDINTTAYQFAPDTFVVCTGESTDWWTNAPYYTEVNWDFGGALIPNTYNAANLNSIVFNTAGIFTVSLQIKTDCCGWSNVIDAVIIVDDIPTLVLAGDPMTYCENGSATLNVVTNGNSVVWTPNYAMNIDTGLVVIFNPPVTSDYVVTALSTYGVCSATTNFTITVNELPDLSSVVVSPTCGNDGSATVNVTNLPGPFNYQWNDPANQTTSTATNLFSGNYTIVVTDQATGCFDSTYVFVDPGTSPLVYISNTVNTSCYLGSDGQATAVVVNAAPPINFVWVDTTTMMVLSTGIGLDTISGLSPGVYNVGITDNNGCTSYTDFTISQPDTSIYLHEIEIEDATCYSSNDGSIMIEPDGGSGSFTFLWGPEANNATTDSIGGLNPGVYNVTITDANDCVYIDSFTVNGPDPALLVDAGLPDTICGNQLNLSATPTIGNATGIWLDNLTTGPGTATFLDVNDAASNVDIANGYGSYTFYWQEDNGIGCLDTSIVEILFIEMPVANAGLADTSCTVIANLSAVPSVGTGWWESANPAVIFSPDEFDPNAQITLPGLGDFTFTWFEDNGFGCVNSSDVVITILNNIDVDFNADITQGCEPLEVVFTDVNIQAPGTICVWNFGDGTGSNDCGQVTHIYSNPGTYDASLIIITPEGCTDTAYYSNLIEVYPNPTALFILNPENGTVIHNEITYTNMSSGAISYNWTFGETASPSLSNDTDPVVSYPSEESGVYETCLVAINEFGCTDTLCKNVSILDELLLFVPNSFSPDGDEFNNIFKAEGRGIDLESGFRMLIFNRWGEVIFESYDINIGWDGTFKSKPVQDGTYTWKITVHNSEIEAEIKEYIGHVTMIR